jgi:5-methylcytosine-specific restriction protein B
MRKENSEQYAMWDEFLSTWPVERVESMTLPEYTSAGSKDTFTYWVESKLDKLGSIWGGSSFKFGIYSRNDTQEVESTGKRLYTAEYGWLEKYGKTPTEAFEAVKREVLKTIRAAMIGDLEQIDTVDLGHAYTWKIAFHYQDRNNPIILPVFKLEMLLTVLKGEKKGPTSEIYRILSSRRPEDTDVLTYGRELWTQYAEMPKIWKISHGKPDFSSEERQRFLSRQYVTVAKETKKSQGEAFAGEMNPGDFFYLCHGNDQGIVLLGRITSEATRGGKGENWLERSYQVIKKLDAPQKYNGITKGWAPNYNSTVMKVKPEDLGLFEEHILKKFFDMELSSLDKNFDSHWTTAQDPGISEFGAMGPNIIYYGPPGTGKTYTLISKGKEHFMESGTTPQPLSEKAMIIAGSNDVSWWQALALALLDLGTATQLMEILEHPIMRAKLRLFGCSHPLAQLHHHLQAHTQLECPNVRYATSTPPHVFWKDEHSRWSVDRDLIKSLAPHLLRLLDQYQDATAHLDAPRYVFTTFHQSLSYEDFVEGIKPVMDDATGTDLSYQIESGIFKRMALRAESNPDVKYAIFIDEINRGNVASIFGELITLIEKDKRRGEENEVTVTLPYSKELFSVPPNLFIIGTMNTADRSIVALDSALRRRFTFVACNPEPTLIEQPADLDVDLQELLTVINQRIAMVLDRDHSIGHSYFMKINKASNALEALRAVFSKEIIPLLEEYFSGDLERVGMILGNRFVLPGDDGNGAVSLAPGDWDTPFNTKGVYVLADIDTLGPADFESIYANA